jgi:two-component system, chemotaxis family, chemotaxis protein CheY
MAKILIVDDSNVMRKKLASIFTEAGHTVIAEAQNGMEAFRAYARYSPDLVTMDITMPVMNGIEAVKKIVPNYPEAKIVMISSVGQKDMVMTALKLGAKHFIVKPFTVEQAKTIIDKVLAMGNNENAVIEN